MGKGIVFNIQRFTIHDGPGIRTEIFLKGCPLSCLWCSNPEGQKRRCEPGIYPSRCLGERVCGVCQRICPITDCITFDQRGILSSLRRQECISCMLCARDCPSEAIKAWGSVKDTAEIMELILRDRDYYENSGGGVTLSGGEPLMQPDFLLEILKACRQEGIHTCVETTLFTDRRIVEKTVEAADLLISDIKMMDSEKHRKYTGVSNRIILDNLCHVAEMKKELILRIPVIPGINDDAENMAATADFLQNDMKGRVQVLELLPFMHMGEEKCRSLEKDYQMKGLQPDRDAFRKEMLELADFFCKRGINCRTAGKGM